MAFQVLFGIFLLASCMKFVGKCRFTPPRVVVAQFLRWDGEICHWAELLPCCLPVLPFLFPCFASDLGGSYEGGFGCDMEWTDGAHPNFLLVEEHFFWEGFVREVGDSLQCPFLSLDDFGCDDGDLRNVAHCGCNSLRV